jgi:hypothetical protein
MVQRAREAVSDHAKPRGKRDADRRDRDCNDNASHFSFLRAISTAVLTASSRLSL